MSSESAVHVVRWGDELEWSCSTAACSLGEVAFARYTLLRWLNYIAVSVVSAVLATSARDAAG